MARTSGDAGPAGTGRARRPRVAVLGSLNMDISVTVPQLPAPGATVLGSAARFSPGGKGANQAVAAARLGAQVTMIGCVGDDEFGGRLLAALRAESVDVTRVRVVRGVPTGIALITVGPGGENIITVAPGANDEVGVNDAVVAGGMAGGAGGTAGGGTAGGGTAGGGVTESSDAVAGDGPAGGTGTAGGEGMYDILVISAEIPVPAIEAALAARHEAAEHGAGNRGTGAVRLLNLAPAPREAARMVASGVDWLVVNEPEAAAVLGRPVTGLGDAGTAARDLAGAGARYAVVTAGAEGAALAGPDGTVTVPGFRVRAVDSVGAGDTFAGALAVALATGAAPEQAVRAACAAAAVAATRQGTQDAMPRPADVLAVTGFRWPLEL